MPACDKGIDNNEISTKSIHIHTVHIHISYILFSVDQLRSCFACDRVWWCHVSNMVIVQSTTPNYTAIQNIIYCLLNKIHFNTIFLAKFDDAHKYHILCQPNSSKNDAYIHKEIYIHETNDHHIACNTKSIDIWKMGMSWHASAWELVLPWHASASGPAGRVGP